MMLTERGAPQSTTSVCVCVCVCVGVGVGMCVGRWVGVYRHACVCVCVPHI